MAEAVFEPVVVSLFLYIYLYVMYGWYLVIYGYSHVFATIELLENSSSHFQYFWPAFFRGLQILVFRDCGLDYGPNLQVQDV